MTSHPAGETHLPALLRAMSPHVTETTYTFATLTDRRLPAGLQPLGMFEERESTTVICPLDDARRFALRHEGAFRHVTLNVHSSLHAVGFIAAISAALRDAGIPCNVVSAFYHDHLFIPADQLDAALDVLQRLSGTSP